MNNDPLIERLQAGSTGLRLLPETRRVHIEAIERALTRQPVPIGRAWTVRRKAAAAVAAMLVVGPGGVAAASADAVPGDALYPAKRVVEGVVAVFDSDVVARHRVEELEALLVRGDEDSVMESAWTDARSAVAGRGSEDPIRIAFDRLQADDAAQPSDVNDVDDAVVAPVPDENDDGVGATVDDSMDDVGDEVDADGTSDERSGDEVGTAPSDGQKASSSDDGHGGDDSSRSGGDDHHDQEESD